MNLNLEQNMYIYLGNLHSCVFPIDTSDWDSSSAKSQDLNDRFLKQATPKQNLSKPIALPQFSLCQTNLKSVNNHNSAKFSIHTRKNSVTKGWFFL